MREIDVAVVGGGVTGLVAARDLARAGRDVRLFDPAPGGKVRTARGTDGARCETGAGVFLGKPDLLGLVDALGLGPDVVYPAGPVTYYVTRGARGAGYVPVPRGPRALLASPLLSPGDKARIVLAALVPGRLRPAGEDESVAEFFGRAGGARLVDNVLAPVLGGVYGGDVARLSARLLFPGLWDHARRGGTLLGYVLRAARRGRGGGGPSERRGGRRRMFVLRGGNDSLCSALSRSLPPGTVVPAAVTALRGEGKGVVVESEGGEPVRAARVIVTTAGSETARFLAPLEPDLASRLAALPWSSLAVVHLLGEAGGAPLPADMFGVLWSERKRLDPIGIMTNSVLFPDAAPAGARLFTVSFGGRREGPGADLEGVSDGELADRAAAAVTSTLRVKGPLRPAAAPARWPRAIPQFEVGGEALRASVSACSARRPALVFAGADLGGVGVPDRVTAGHAAAGRAAAGHAAAGHAAAGLAVGRSA